MSSRCSFAWAAALLLAPAVVMPMLFAQGPPQGQPRVFLVALDLDRDGQLSAAEIAAAGKSLLVLDKNHDGQITSDEYSPRVAAVAPNASPVANATFMRLMEMDANKDGVLTKNEVPERMLPMFERGDTNHDGKLDGDELHALAAAQADPQGRAVGRGNAPVNLRTDPIPNVIDADHDGVFSAAEIANAPAMLKTLDKDGDGMLSVEELKVRPQTPRERAAHSLDEWDGDRDGFLVKADLPDQLQANFEKMDTNHDGKIDLDELAAFMATQPAGRGPGGPGGPGGRPGGPGSPGERPAGTPDNNAAPAR